MSRRSLLLVAQGADRAGCSSAPPGILLSGKRLFPVPDRQAAAKRAECDIIVNELTASLPGRTEQIIYWTRVGARCQQLGRAAPGHCLRQLAGFRARCGSGADFDRRLDRDGAVESARRFAEAILEALGPDDKALVAKT